MMYFRSTILFLILVISMIQSQDQNEKDKKMVKAFFDKALTEGRCYEDLRYLCKNMGHRLSGSVGAAKAVQWGKEILEELGMKVHLQEVMVPHWERGKIEQANLVDSKRFGNKKLHICALGGSIGTDKDGVTAEIIEVHNFKQLAQLGKDKIHGKIVFYNRPMEPTYIKTFRAYGQAVNQRTRGASKAAAYGAVATLVRSLTLSLDNVPHTGVMFYQKDIAKIPSAAISTRDAEILGRLLQEEKKVKVNIKLSCQSFPDVKSYNVIGEIKGTQYPQEIIAVGGHLDAWDKGEGAHDDGAGCVHASEVVHLFKKLKLKPKRTIRVVFFMNEENGLRGAKKYAQVVKEKKEIHIAAIESDAGAFTPRGFSIDAPKEKLEQIKKWQSLFAPYGIQIYAGGSGADIGQLKNGSTALIGYRPDSQRYFDFHHAHTDVFEAINKRELEMGSAAITSLVYLLDTYGLK